MSIHNVYDQEWQKRLGQLFGELLLESEVLDSAAKMHILSEEDVEKMGEEYEQHDDLRGRAKL